jgi:hypothetical protein
MLLPAGFFDETLRKADIELQERIDCRLRKMFANAIARGVDQDCAIALIAKYRRILVEGKNRALARQAAAWGTSYPPKGG